MICTKNAANWLTHIWIQMNWVNEVDVGKPFGEIGNRRTDVLKSFSKVFATMARYQYHSFIRRHKFRRNTINDRRMSLVLFPHKHQGIYHGIPCHVNIFLWNTFFQQIGPVAFRGAEVPFG